ncbi:MFS transporter [Streptomyces sp. NPDC041068]|uniref:MFS transporter n=1 Tax=Streptomyces sp. NPDC041068 TaxID=3155130 RepID=UPI0033E3B40B
MRGDRSTSTSASASASLPEPSSGTAYRWVVLGIATFTQAAAAFFVQGVGALGLHLQRDLHLSTTQLGLLLSAAQLVPLIGLSAAGALLDRHSERWVVGAGACVVGAGLLVGSAAPGYASLLLVMLVVGAGYSTVQPGGSKSVAAWFAPSRRGLAMGIRQAGLPLGAALASASLPVLAEAYGLRSALVAGGLVALLGAGVFMAFHRRPPHGTTRTGGGPPIPLTTQLRERLRMLREPSMARIMLSGTSLISVQYGVGVLTVLHLHRTASVDADTAAVVLVAAQGAGVAGRICLAAWSDRATSGRYASVRACLVAVTAGTVALMTPLGHSPTAACVVFVGLGFFGLGWYGPWVAYVAESAPPGRTGFALGLAMSVNQIAIVLAPPALGLLIDLTHGFTPAWGVLSALTAAALVLTLDPRSPGHPGSDTQEHASRAQGRPQKYA